MNPQSRPLWQRVTEAHPLLLTIGAALTATAVATALAVVVLGAPPADAQALSLLLAGSGIASLGLAYVGLTLAGRLRSGGLLLKLTIGNLLGIMVLCTNVVATAYLMFISPHDLGLLGLLMLFASALAVVFAFSLAQSITGAVGLLVTAAEKMERGDLAVRVALRTGDELEALAQAFNRMAQEVEAAALRQRELELARRELIAAVSHDLRTPLATVQAMVEAINDGVVSDPETLRRYHETMLREVRGFGRLVDDLLELSQIDAGVLRLHLELASLPDLISDALTSMSAQAAQHQVRLTGQVQSELAPLFLDPARIQRVLANLVQNALRHTPPDGTVLLEAEDAGSEVRVRVVDTGEGIPAAELPHLFERFYRGERSRSRETGGAGLGLAIAKGLVEAHGGRIWAESTGTGRGSCFTFTLPCSAASATTARHDR